MGVNPVCGSISAPSWMQPLGQASMHRPHALQNLGTRNGFSLDFLRVAVDPDVVTIAAPSSRRPTRPPQAEAPLGRPGRQSRGQKDITRDFGVGRNRSAL
jgi:hypothetical protein